MCTHEKYMYLFTYLFIMYTCIYSCMYVCAKNEHMCMYLLYVYICIVYTQPQIDGCALQHCGVPRVDVPGPEELIGAFLARGFSRLHRIPRRYCHLSGLDACNGNAKSHAGWYLVVFIT